MPRVGNPQTKIKYNCRNSPQRARLPSYIGLLVWKNLCFGKMSFKMYSFENDPEPNLGKHKELTWEIKNFILPEACTKCHKLEDSGRSSSLKESESDPYADLGDPAGESL